MQYQLSTAYKNINKVQAKFKEYSDTFDVDLINLYDMKPDCKIGHFGYNFWFRTPYGLQSKQYKSWSTLIKAISKVSKNNGLTLEYLEVNGRSKLYLS